LRSALSAANLSPQADTIVLAAGTYAAPPGGVAVLGKVRITGAGPGQTLLQARHLDRLFEVDDGNLDLAGLTLAGGTAATLLKGNIHLTDCQFADTDALAVARA